MSEGIENKSSVYADEGSAAHELAQACLEAKQDAADYLGRYVDLDARTNDKRFPRDEIPNHRCFFITDEMAESVQVYLDACREHMVELAGWEFEAKLDLTHIPGMAFGTGDFVAYDPEAKRLVVVDLKYGRGVPVEVEQNEQLLVYAVGVARRFHNQGVAEIVMTIVQPRCPHPKGPVRSATIDAVDLVEFQALLARKAGEAQAADAPLKPGEHCRFCPAAPACPALRGHAVAVAEMEFSDEPPVVTELTPEKMADVLREAETIEGWVKRVKDRAHQMAIEGAGVPGFKLVESTTHRKFKDDVAAPSLAMLLDVEVEGLLTEPKLKSPAQVEKLLGAKRKGEIAGFVFKPRGKIILVPDSDPREPVKVDAEEEFA